MSTNARTLLPSFIRALISIALGGFVAAVARGDNTWTQFTTDLQHNWVYFTGAVAAPALIVLENKILGDKQ